MAKKKKNSMTRQAEHVERGLLDTKDKAVNNEQIYTLDTQTLAPADIKDAATAPERNSDFHESTGNSELHRDLQNTKPSPKDKSRTIPTQPSPRFNAWVQACRERKRAEANTASEQADAIDAKVARLGLLEDQMGALAQKIRATEEEMTGLLRDIEQSCYGILPLGREDSTSPGLNDHNIYAN